MDRKEFLYNKLTQLDIEPTENQISQLILYFEMLVEKNRVMNLTAITDFEEVAVKHFIDSLAIVKVIDFECVDSVADIGTGAGFPGIPIKIMFPHVDVLLADSLNKRVLFLRDVISTLNLKEVQAVHGRAEDLGRDVNYRDKFDLCVSRAVANMSVLLEYCIPFVKPDGKFVSYKAGNSKEEIALAKKAVKALNGEIERIQEFELPETDIKRSFVVIKKIGKTPKAYPRKSGTPSKNPIC